VVGRQSTEAAYSWGKRSSGHKNKLSSLMVVRKAISDHLDLMGRLTGSEPERSVVSRKVLRKILLFGDHLNGFVGIKSCLSMSKVVVWPLSNRTFRRGFFAWVVRKRFSWVFWGKRPSVNAGSKRAVYPLQHGLSPKGRGQSAGFLSPFGPPGGGGVSCAGGELSVTRRRSGKGLQHEKTSIERDTRRRQFKCMGRVRGSYT